MILRKPYAFFIKHFKLFNIILTFLEIYVVYKLGFLFQFFLEYSKNPVGAIGQDLTGTLINNLVFIVGIIIIAFSIIMMTVLSIKKKPVKLYMLILIVNVAVLILLFVCFNVLETIELHIIENKLAYGIRDFTLIGILLELVVSVCTLIRAIGFDIKSFKFGQDLENMKIDASDNEEFELQIDVDSSKFKRDINRNKRYFKYFIYEHKFSIMLVATIIIGFVSFMIYSKSGIYFNMIKPEKLVKVDNFSLGTTGSYLTTKDYKGKTVTKDTLIVIPIKVKTNSIKEKLNVARFELVIGNNRYSHITNYQDRLIDFGTTYNDQILTTDFENYILVFEVPTEYSKKSMYLEYNAENEKSLKFSVKPKTIDGENNALLSSLGKTLKISNNLIKSGNLTIDTYEISDKFKVDYKFCITNNECYDSYEYIVPDYKSNYDKTILKIDGNVEIEESNISISNLYDFINKFGSLVYTKDGVTKRQNVSFVEVKPSKINLKNTYYIEILDEIKYADEITLEIRLRNAVYSYKLK